MLRSTYNGTLYNTLVANMKAVRYKENLVERGIVCTTKGMIVPLNLSKVTPDKHYREIHL